MAEKITVTSQDLLKEREEWLAVLEKARKDYLAAVLDSKKLVQFFDGNPVRKLQKEFVSAGEEGTKAFRRLKLHIEKLGEIAAVYEEAERGNVDVATND